MTDLSRKLRDLDKDLESGFYRNYGTLTAEEAGAKPNCEDMDSEDKRRIIRIANARTDFLHHLDLATEEEAGWGLWKSDTLRSFVFMFDPESVRMDDDESEDWRILETKVSILLKILRSDPHFKFCQDRTASILFATLEAMRSNAEEKGEEE